MTLLLMSTINDNMATGGRNITINVPATVAYLDTAGNRGITGRSNIVNKYDSRFIGMSFKTQSALLLTTPNNIGSEKALPEILGTNQFLLTALREVRQEKVQILETFGAPSLYFFDEKTKVYGLTGVLLEANPANTASAYEFGDDSDFTRMRDESKEWVGGFQEFWDKHLRGSQLVKDNRIALLVFGNDMMYGYPVSFTLTKNSGTPNHRLFNMSMIVTDHVVKETYSYYYTPYLNEDILMVLEIGSVIDQSKIAELSDLVGTNITGTSTVLDFFDRIGNAITIEKENLDTKYQEYLTLEMSGEDSTWCHWIMDNINDKIKKIIAIKADVEQKIFMLSKPKAALKLKLSQ